MRTNRLAAFLCIITAAVFLPSCRDPVATSQIPTITALVLKQSDNPVLGADIHGVVNEQNKMIEVALPDALLSRTALKATVSLGPDSTLLNDTPRDYSVSPLSYAVTNGDGDTSSYLVKVIKEYSSIDPKALFFSEYYAGTEYTLKGSNNQYLEITNRSGVSLDLGGYELCRSVWENGVRRADKDVRVRLNGMLEAGKSLVIYSNRLAALFTNIWSLPEGTAQIDSVYNTIIAFSGQDGFRLLYNGNVTDVLGPNEGLGDGSSWGALKLMLRKADKIPSSTWNDVDWISYAGTNTVSDTTNAGNDTPVGVDTKLTYFVVADFSVPVYGELDHVLRTVQVSIPEFESKKLSPIVSTDGSEVWYNGSPIISRQTEIDCTNPVTVQVIPLGGTIGTAIDYTVIVTTFGELKFTDTNYDFDGGIAASIAKISKSSGNGDPYTYTNTKITGIVTARDIWFHKTATKCFFIQDKNTGLFIFTDIPLDTGIRVGHKIEIEILEGKYYYDMPEITSYGVVKKVNNTQYDLYYQTGAFNNLSCVSKVYRYTGKIVKEMDNYSVGTLENNLFFHGTDEVQLLLKQDDYGDMYGPVTYSFSQYRMEISQSYQIKK